MHRPRKVEEGKTGPADKLCTCAIKFILLQCLMLTLHPIQEIFLTAAFILHRTD